MDVLLRGKIVESKSNFHHIFPVGKLVRTLKAVVCVL